MELEFSNNKRSSPNGGVIFLSLLSFWTLDKKKLPSALADGLEIIKVFGFSPIENTTIYVAKAPFEDFFTVS